MTAPISDEEVAEAVARLEAGGVVAVPTETVYGLAVDARSPDAIRRLFRVKGRPADRPLPVLLPGAEFLERWAAEVPDAARRLAEALWPGPLTLVLPKAAGVPDILTAGRPTVGLRVPDHPLTLGVLRAFGDGLATPSANLHGGVSATSAEEVRAELGDRVQLILDGGPCRVGVESTVVDFASGAPQVLRAGAVGRERLEALIGEGASVEVRSGQGTAFTPRTPVALVERADLVARARAFVEAGEDVVVVAPPDHPALPAGVRTERLPADASERRRRFYGILREADRLGADRLLVEAPSTDTAWGRAVRDRLRGPRP